MKKVLLILLLLLITKMGSDAWQRHQIQNYGPSTLIDPDNKTLNSPSGLSQLLKIFTRDYGPPDDGIRRVGSAFPDADRSECKGMIKSPKDFMIVNFAGYVLKLPCTVKPIGDYNLGFNQDGSINFQKFNLNFGVNLGQKNYDGIWWQGRSDERGTIGFHVGLRSNGEQISSDLIKKWLVESQQIQDIPEQNLVVFMHPSKRRVKAFIKDKLKEGEYINISCDLYGNPDPYQIFTPLHNIGNKSNCNAYWNLTDDIKVRVLDIKSENAYHFNMSEFHL